MPSVLIDIRRVISPEAEVAIMEAVHVALREAFQIPAHDRNLRLVAHAPHRFAAPPLLVQPELFTCVTIDAFAGRSLDTKRALYAAIVAGLVPLGIPKDHVRIVLHESPRDNWGIRGGQAASDVELGFKVDV